MPDHRFTVIPGGSTPRSYNKPRYDTELGECRHCAPSPEAPGPSVWVAGIAGPRVSKKTGKVVQASKVWLCAYCKRIMAKR
jgi:hypothetical protein